MKRILTISFMLAVVAIVLGSCSNNNTSMRKKITGKAGEMVVVLPKTFWNGAVGTAFKDVMAQPQLGLPQEEPIFDLIDVPPEAFKDIFKTTRNIVRITIESTVDTAKVEFRKDIWAWPQAVVDIKAPNKQAFLDIFKKNSDRIVAYFLKAERERLMGNYNKYYDKAVKNELLKKFDIFLNVPPGFVITNNKKNFVWVRYETPEISQGILIYSYPYKSDSTFTEHFQLFKRDSVLRANVEGPTKGSFMTSEHQLPPTFNVFRFKGNYASEMRGLWRVEGDFMGGPYISLSVLDASKNRIVTLDGFVYAPKYDKRNYIRQVEAMMYSLEFPDQKKNDKINSQINMGN